MSSCSNETNSATNIQDVAAQTGSPTIEEIVSYIEQERRSLAPRFPMFNFSNIQLARIRCEICRIVDTKLDLPNGRGRSSKLDANHAKQLRIDLLDAAGFAGCLITRGQLKNRARWRGRPPDNVTFIFIDDLMQACQKAGLKPGRRFVTDSQSLPVRLYIALAPILGFGKPKNPRRLFERWKRLVPDLIRRTSHPVIICSKLGASTLSRPEGNVAKRTRRYPAGHKRRGHYDHPPFTHDSRGMFGSESRANSAISSDSMRSATRRQAR